MTHARKDIGDVIFRRLMMGFSCGVIALMLGMFVLLAQSSWLSIRKFGFAFLFSSKWDPVFEVFGALPFIYGTLLTAFVALLIAVPIGVGTAIYLAEYAPQWVRVLVFSIIEDAI